MSEVVTAPPQPAPATRSRRATREVWMERLARFADTGLTVAQFCAREAISVPSFYSWKRRISAQANPQDATADRPLPLLPVRLQPLAPLVELVLPTGLVLRLPSGCDLDWVRSLVASLGEPSC
jgi:hypothetical protein